MRCFLDPDRDGSGDSLVGHLCPSLTMFVAADSMARSAATGLPLMSRGTNESDAALLLSFRE
jgi:hypothetical protein